MAARLIVFTIALPVAMTISKLSATSVSISDAVAASVSMVIDVSVTVPIAFVTPDKDRLPAAIYIFISLNKYG